MEIRYRHRKISNIHCNKRKRDIKALLLLRKSGFGSFNVITKPNQA